VRRRYAQLQLDPPDALVGPLDHRPLGAQQVADHAEGGDDDAGVKQHGAEDQRLDVARAVALGVGDDEAHPDGERAEQQDRRGGEEHAQRLVLGVDAEDRDRVAADVGGGRGEQARLARHRVGRDRDVIERHQLLAGLDDRLERVGEVRDDQDLQRGLAVVGAEAGRRVRHVGSRSGAHDARAEPLEALLQRREVLDRGHVAVADHHVGGSGDNRGDELRDIGAAVLVVRVGVDDHVGPQLQRRVHAGLECAREPLVVGQANDVLDAERARDVDRRVGRAVVDHEPLDRVEAVEPARQIGQRGRQLLGLVLAGNLDDQLHRVRCRPRVPSTTVP
jgi:hypothetical protein